MKALNFAFLTAACACVATSASALSKTELDTGVSSTLQKCYAEVKVCKNLVDTSAGALVFPEVTKGGLGIAYESGTGALVEHGKTVGYYTTKATSLGATIGVGSKSIIVAFRTPEELAKFKKSSGWEAGGDAGVAMIDTGAAGTMDTKNIKQDVVGLVFGESGVIADVSIKGAKISPIEAKDIS